MPNEYRTSVKLTPELKEKLKIIAAKQNRSVHNLIITILIEYVNEHLPSRP
jgi:predicted transcriptional regulator